jgi:hypothetical protein
MRKYGYEDLWDEPEEESRENIRKYIKECRRCGEETLIGIDWRSDTFPADHFIHDDTICSECKTEMLGGE